MGSVLKKVPLHPFLLALYPMLYLLSVNIDQVDPAVAFRSLFIPFAGVTALLLVFALLSKSWRKAALAASLWVVVVYLLFFFLYVPLYHAVEKMVIGGVNVGRHRVLLGGILLLLALAAWFILRIRKDVSIPTSIINLVAVVLILLPVFQIVSYQIRSQTLAAPPALVEMDQSALSLPEGKTPPDVYYIILDMYTRQDVLQDFFEYDNTEFLKFLEEKGFEVAACSQSNYTITQYSLSSSLNYEYLQTLGYGVDDPEIVQAIDQSRVRRSLEELGYKTVAFESGYSLTELRDADVYLSPFGNLWNGLLYGGVNSFEAMVLQNSAGKLLYEAKPNLSRKYQTILDTPYIQYRERIDFTLQELETVARIPGPKFVFAHILAPHDPFVFDRDGNFIYRETPFTLNNDKEYTAETYVAGYRDELMYLNTRVENVVAAILEQSSTPPIIILQGDHGAPRSKEIDGYSAILNAYHLPDGGAEGLPPTITPVNTFRWIFNEYFGGTYPLLQDIPYVVDLDAGAYVQYPGYPCSAVR